MARKIKDQKFVLFGAGIVGERCYHLLKNNYNIACFADNDPNKHGTKYLSLDVINPSVIAETGLMVILSVASHKQLVIIRQLFDMGIKEFCISEHNCSEVLTHIDLSSYQSLEVQKNKICVLRYKHAAAISSGLIKNNPFHDLVVVTIDWAKINTEYFYHYITCSLVISHFNEEIDESKKTIDLWHGFPVKALGYLNRNDSYLHMADTDHNRYISKDIVCSTSKLYSIFFGYCYNIPYDKFRITGYPRNDMLFISDGRKNIEMLFGNIEQRYILIYLPTYRTNLLRSDKIFFFEGEESFIFNMEGFDAGDFDSFLCKNNILLIYKTHAVEKQQELFKETENIKMLTDEMLNEYDMDLNETLNGTDCLISDYSGAIIDYLLIDKPIILTPTDLEVYSKNRGLLLEPYEAWMPGEIAVDYEQLKIAIVNALFGEDIYKGDRDRLKKITHKYNDANSSRRVLEVARELIGL